MPAAPPMPGIYLAAGPRLLPSWFLSALCPALKYGRRVFWIDAGNSFDAHGMSYTARGLGWDPRPVLRQVSLARPFNLFQLETMVCRKVPAQWRGEPVIVSDPFPMLYDEDVPLPQARKVFVNVLNGMKALPALWLVLAVDRKAPQGREGWTQGLAAQASGLARLESRAERWQLARPN